MRSILTAILLSVALAHADDQPQSASPPSRLKLEGLVIAQEPGGYLVVAVPPKDVKRFVVMAGMLAPHIAVLKVLERLDAEAHKLAPIPTPDGVPLGKCFLSTNEVFRLHKILDRYVQPVGTFTYTNVRGLPVTVKAYAGGPMQAPSR